MKIGIAVWNSVVSSVFDFAGEFVLVEVDGGVEKGRSRVKLVGQGVYERVREVADTGAEVVICGAISRQLAEMLSAGGVEVVPFVSGPVDEVLAAYLNGRLSEPRFLQAGCRPGLRRRFGCRRRHGRGRGGFGRGRGAY